MTVEHYAINFKDSCNKIIVNVKKNNHEIIYILGFFFYVRRCDLSIKYYDIGYIVFRKYTHYIRKRH